MYSNEDLNEAVKKEIFTQEAVDKFRGFISHKQHTPLVDEENFKLLSGFNDIFVVIASLLLLGSVSWITSGIDILFSTLILALLSWGLTEFFVRKRKMPLPAIVLLIAFISSLFWGLNTFFGIDSPESTFISAGITGIATYLHWRRFKVPITVAIGVTVLIVFTLSLIVSIFPNFENHWAFLILLFGVATFFLAMYWDSIDTQRLTMHSDVAFWLHLLSAPLIVHSIFILLGVFETAHNGLERLVSIVVLYIILSTLSLIVDRRAFMVSSLVYVIYALNALFTRYGIENNSFALTGVLIGFTLPEFKEQVQPLEK